MERSGASKNVIDFGWLGVNEPNRRGSGTEGHMRRQSLPLGLLFAAVTTFGCMGVVEESMDSGVGGGV